MNKTISAIVLAAGLGTRLAPLTNKAPKCLTELFGRPLLSYALDALIARQLGQVVVVVGHRADQIRAYVESNYCAAKVIFVNNDDYATTGTAVSIMRGLSAIPSDHGVLIIEADVVFDQIVLDRLLSAPGTATALARYRPDLSGSFVTMDVGLHVTDWAHERGRSADFPLGQAWKTVNLTKIDAAAVHTHLQPAVAKMLAVHGPAVPFEFVAQHCISEQGLVINGVDVSDARWYEIDTLADLESAKNLFA